MNHAGEAGFVKPMSVTSVIFSLSFQSHLRRLRQVRQSFGKWETYVRVEIKDELWA
jgi:hypothetical protein